MILSVYDMSLPKDTRFKTEKLYAYNVLAWDEGSVESKDWSFQTDLTHCQSQ